MLVEAIFWFYPVVWWMERQLVKERERACDEAVLQLGNEAAVYAESIINVCKFFTESPTTCISGVMGSELKQRVARILSGQGKRKLDLRRKATLTMACVLAVGVPLAAGFLRAANGQTQPTQENGIEKSGIAGTWQGTEHTPDSHGLRMVLKIAKNEKGALSATLYSLDQTELYPASGSVSFQEGKLRFVFDSGLTSGGRCPQTGIHERDDDVRQTLFAAGAATHKARGRMGDSCCACEARSDGPGRESRCGGGHNQTSPRRGTSKWIFQRRRDHAHQKPNARLHYELRV